MVTKRAGRFRLFLWHVAVLAGVLLWVAASTMSICAEPSLLPHRPSIAGFGSLCDAGPLFCTRIDEIGFNALIPGALDPSSRAACSASAFRLVRCALWTSRWWFTPGSATPRRSS